MMPDLYYPQGGFLWWLPADVAGRWIILIGVPTHSITALAGAS